MKMLAVIYFCALMNYGTSMYIWYSTMDGIFRYKLTYGTHTTIYTHDGQYNTAIDFENDTNCLLFSNRTGIQQLCLSGNHNTLETVVRFTNNWWVASIAYDWVGGNIFWVTESPPRLSVAGKNGSNQRLLFDREHIDKPRGIALDPQQGWMYWTDRSSLNPRIARAQMNGDKSSYEVLVHDKDKILFPNCLTIDYQQRDMYWTDYLLHSVMKASLTGENVKTIASRGEISYPLGIGLYKSILYWTDWNKNALMNIDTSQDNAKVQILASNISKILDLKVVSTQAENCKIKQILIQTPDNGTEVYVYTDRATTINCKVEAEASCPPIKVEWYQDSVNITGNAGINTTYRTSIAIPGSKDFTSSYTITNGKGNHTVTCKAFGDNGTTQPESGLVKVVFIAPPTDNLLLTMSVNSTKLFLSCSQKGGNPPPTVKWEGTCAGKGIFEGYNNDIIKSVIIITNEKEKNDINCSCQISNPHYNSSSTKMVYFMPSIVKSPDNLSHCQTFSWKGVAIGAGASAALFLTIFAIVILIKNMKNKDSKSRRQICGGPSFQNENAYESNRLVYSVINKDGDDNIYTDLEIN